MRRTHEASAYQMAAVPPSDRAYTGRVHAASSTLRRALVLLSSWIAWVGFAGPAAANQTEFKSPASGMHFTQGQPLVIFADLSDTRARFGMIVCPGSQTISNTSPPPDYSDPPRMAQCSGGGTPTGWPQLQVLIDGAVQTDIDTHGDTIPNTISFNHDINPDPIDFHRFRAPSAGLGAGPHQIVARGVFSIDGVNITTLDSDPITVFIDAPPAKSTVTLNSDLNGTVSWNNVIVVGNGHSVTASGSLVITNSLVTGLSGLTGSVSDADIEGSIFEDTGALDLTLGAGAVTIANNEFRANNRLTFVADDPSVPFIATFRGSGGAQKTFQGNRVGAGQLKFTGSNWLIGGDSDDKSNVFMGPRCVLNIAASNTIVRGNYSHHNYRGGWSQGFNFYYQNAGSGVLTEHNFIRDSSWPLQYLAGEFRYNVVYGYGHTWLRTAASNAIIHHNLFAPGGDGGLDAGLQCYTGETGLQIYNNTFDGGGDAEGDFSNATVDMSGGSQVVSFRNNLVTYSRDQANGSPGAVRVKGGGSSYLYADYNAFYSPDNSNKTNYDFTAGAHDASDAASDQLADNPFAGARITTDSDRMIESTIDEAAVWQGTQKVSQVLAIFRARYTPKAGSPVVDGGDPQDNDSSGRRADVGAIDLGGHDLDKLGKFGTPPSETVPPTVSLTSPQANATVMGAITLTATAQDNAGGSGVVLVQFLVDGGVVGQTSKTPYSISFDTRIVSNANHAFSAKAWDAAGNSAVSASVTVTVAGNVGPPPPPPPTPDAGVPSGPQPDGGGGPGGPSETGSVSGACGLGTPVGAGAAGPLLVAVCAIAARLLHRRRR